MGLSEHRVCVRDLLKLQSKSIKFRDVTEFVAEYSKLAMKLVVSFTVKSYSSPYIIPNEIQSVMLEHEACLILDTLT